MSSELRRKPMDLDRSTMFTVLLDVWPEFGRFERDKASSLVSMLLQQWWRHPGTDMYAWAKKKALAAALEDEGWQVTVQGRPVEVLDYWPTKTMDSYGDHAWEAMVWARFLDRLDTSGGWVSVREMSYRRAQPDTFYGEEFVDREIIKRPKVGQVLATSRYGLVTVTGVSREGVALTVRDRQHRDWTIGRAQNGWWVRLLRADDAPTAGQRVP